MNECMNELSFIKDTEMFTILYTPEKKWKNIYTSDKGKLLSGVFARSRICFKTIAHAWAET